MSPIEWWKENPDAELPLYQLRRHVGLARARMWRWWNRGLVHPQDRGLPPTEQRRIRLETFITANGRATTWNKYLAFMRARDVRTYAQQ